MSAKKSLMLVGSYPPPYGGCSVHVQRLQKSLMDTFDVSVLDMYGNTTTLDSANNVYRCGKKRLYNLIKAVFILAKTEANLVHFHVAYMGNFLFAGFLLLFFMKNETSKVVSIHSGSFVKKFSTTNIFKKKLLAKLLDKFDHIITVNAEQKVMIEGLGIMESKISVVPAFLPPIAKASAEIMSNIDKLHTQDKIIIISSGYALSYYGFHTILDMLESNPEYKNNVSVVFCFYNTYDEKYLADLEKRLKSINHLIFKDLSPDEFSYVLSQSDVYVRATDRDGDAVAIREAAFFGKKIIASDCVARPKGTELFEVNNALSLKHALKQVMHDKNSGIVTFNYYDNRKKIDIIYTDLLNIRTNG